MPKRATRSFSSNGHPRSGIYDAGSFLFGLLEETSTARPYSAVVAQNELRATFIAHPIATNCLPKAFALAG